MSATWQKYLRHQHRSTLLVGGMLLSLLRESFSFQSPVIPSLGGRRAFQSLRVDFKPVPNHLSTPYSIYGHLSRPIQYPNLFPFHIKKSPVRPRSAAATQIDPWLSEKDVDAILREQGPGSMRPNPLVPAERYTSRDWLISLLTLPTALEFKRIFSHLLANTIFAVMVWLGYVHYPNTVGFLTAGLHPGAHLLLGGALGLLLVFRTNTAYDRFWEGRRLWGFLISRVREVCASGKLENLRQRRRAEGVALRATRNETLRARATRRPARHSDGAERFCAADQWSSDRAVRARSWRGWGTHRCGGWTGSTSCSWWRPFPRSCSRFTTRIDHPDGRKDAADGVGECQEQHDAKPSARTHS